MSQHCWAQHVAYVWPPCSDVLQRARSIRPKIPVWLSEFSYVEWNGIFHNAGPISFHSRLSTFYSTKMLKDHGKVAVLSAVSCFIEINLTHTGIQNSSLIFTWPTQTPFSRDESNLRTFLVGKYAREVCKQSELNLRKFGTTSPQFSPENQILT